MNDALCTCTCELLCLAKWSGPAMCFLTSWMHANWRFWFVLHGRIIPALVRAVGLLHCMASTSVSQCALLLVAC